MSLTDRLQSRRQCPEVSAGRRCERQEHDLEDPCANGDYRWRLPAWMRRKALYGLPALDLTNRSAL
jgi:hypothetical protein